MKKFGTYVNATQLGKDYDTLRQILNKYPLYNNSLLVGPSTTRLRNSEIEEYLLEFLEAGDDAISALTFHQYAFQNCFSADYFLLLFIDITLAGKMPLTMNFWILPILIIWNTVLTQ